MHDPNLCFANATFSIKIIDMKALFKSIPIFVLLALASVSCKKDGKLATDALSNVPPTATSITAIDLKRLMQKADFEAVKKMEFYQNLMTEVKSDEPNIAKVLANPAESGIDLQGRIYTAIDLNPENPEEMTTYFFLPLKDEAAFEKLWNQQQKNLLEKNGVKFYDTGGNALVGWKDGLGVFAFTNETSDAFVERFVDVFTKKTDNPLAKDENLQKALSVDHDINSWISTSALAKNPGAGFALSMINVKASALENNFIHSYGDFENGKMVGHADFTINKGLGEDFIGRFFKKEVKTDFSKVLPSENLNFATVVALDPIGIDKFLSERPQSKEYADFVLNDLGMERKDLMAAFNGDMMVAGHSSGEEGESSQQGMVALAVSDKAKVKALLEKAVKDNKLKEVEPNLYAVTSVGNEDVAITWKKSIGKVLLLDQFVVFSTEDQLLNAIKSGKTGAGNSASVLGSFDDQTLAGWLDMKSLYNISGGMMPKNMLREMRYKVNGKGADFVLETTDPNTNSLKTLFLMVNEAYLKSKSDRQENL